MSLKSLQPSKELHGFLHAAMKEVARIAGRESFEINLVALASRMDFPLEAVIEHLSKDGLIEKIIDRLQELFESTVKKAIHVSPCTGKKKVALYLRRVDLFLKDYPEAGSVLAMYFFTDVLVSPHYQRLSNYFRLWRDTLKKCLEEIVSHEIAGRIADSYMTVFIGGLYQSDLSSVRSQSGAAERFLEGTLEYLETQKINETRS